MEFPISKKLIFLASSLLLLSIISIMVITISIDSFNSYNDTDSDFSLKINISNPNTLFLWTTDINGNLIDDFKPGENVYIHGSNFISNSYVEINLKIGRAHV